MSASREKKTRQGLGADYLSPQKEKERKEQASIRRTTIIFTVCAVLFLAFVAFMMIKSSNIIQRRAAAVSVNGETYTAADLAYYYYGTLSNERSSAGDSIDTSRSLRDQPYLDGSQSWYDHLMSTSLETLSQTAVAVKAANDAGFTGGEELEASVKETMTQLTEAASGSGYTVSQYLKLIYGPLMTRRVFERNLRMGLLADAYVRSTSTVANFSEADLAAERDKDSKTYYAVSYEYILLYNSDFLPEDENASETGEETEVDEAAQAARDAAAADAAAAAAADAVARIKAGTSPETIADELNASYSSYDAYYTAGDLNDWLFDDARKDGDVTNIDYYGVGTIIAVFHSKQLADFHPVTVRHILVDDEATANDLLAQFNAGDKSEASFAALATENTTDQGSAESGGLYTDVRKGQMVKPFENWCFDASRQPGDTGIVQTDYGYHVMYYVSQSEYAYWQTLAATNLGNSRYTALLEGVQIDTLSGAKYIDPM